MKKRKTSFCWRRKIQFYVKWGDAFISIGRGTDPFR